VLQEMARQGAAGETGVRRQFASSSQDLAYTAQDINLNLKNSLDSLRAQKVSNTQLGLQLAGMAGSAHMAGVQSGMIPETASGGAASIFKNPFGIGLG